jgi:hypothetical protein
MPTSARGNIKIKTECSADPHSPPSQIYVTARGKVISSEHIHLARKVFVYEEREREREREIRVTGEIFIYKFANKRGFCRMIHLLPHELSCNIIGG